MLSLLDHSEEKLQEKILTGKPPLGPGADPVERIVAYGRAKIALAPVQAEMLNEAQLLAIADNEIFSFCTWRSTRRASRDA